MKKRSMAYSAIRLAGHHTVQTILLAEHATDHFNNGYNRL
jgi:hypothetical protein